MQSFRQGQFSVTKVLLRGSGFLESFGQLLMWTMRRRKAEGVLHDGAPVFSREN